MRYVKCREMFTILVHMSEKCNKKSKKNDVPRLKEAEGGYNEIL